MSLEACCFNSRRYDDAEDIPNKTYIRMLARFSNDVRGELSCFLLYNKKSADFDRVCEKAKKIIGSVYPSDFSSMFSSTEWYQSPLIGNYLFRNFIDKEESLEDMKKRLISEIEKVQRAENVAGVRDSFDYLRKKFSELYTRCDEDTRPSGDTVI